MQRESADINVEMRTEAHRMHGEGSDINVTIRRQKKLEMSTEELSPDSGVNVGLRTEAKLEVTAHALTPNSDIEVDIGMEAQTEMPTQVLTQIVKITLETGLEVQKRRTAIMLTASVEINMEVWTEVPAKVERCGRTWRNLRMQLTVRKRLKKKYVGTTGLGYHELQRTQSEQSIFHFTCRTGIGARSVSKRRVSMTRADRTVHSRRNQHLRQYPLTIASSTELAMTATTKDTRRRHLC